MSELEPQNGTTERRDTVSLVDLMVVLLRFRTWIVGLTLTGVILSFGYFWLLPKFNVIKVAPETSYTTQVTIGVMNSPRLLEQYFDTRTGDLVSAWFQNLGLIAPLYREFVVQGNSAFHEGQFADLGSLETYLQESVMGKTLKVTLEQSTATLRVTMEDPDADRAKAFLAAVAQKVKKQINQIMQKRIQAARKSLDEALSAIGKAGLTIERVSAQADLLQKSTLLDQLFNDPDFPLQQQGEILVMEQVNGKGSSNKALSPNLMIVVISILSLFGSVFLAFVMNYIRRIRSSDEDMGKIRSALEKTPRSR